MKPTKTFVDEVPCHLEVEAKTSVSGTFSVSLFNTDIVLFKYVPDVIAPFNINQINITETVIYFFLHQLQSIQFESEVGIVPVVYVKFANPKLPSQIRFVFTNNAYVQINNCFNELKAMNFITNHSVYKNFFNINTKSEKKFIFPDDWKTLSQVHCLLSHKKMVDSLPKLDDEHVEFSLDDFKKYLNDDGSLKNYIELRDTVHASGLSDEARPYVWPYLMKFYEPEMTNEQKDEIVQKRLKEYSNLCIQCENLFEEQYKYSKCYQVIKHDVDRTDKTSKFFEERGNESYAMLQRILSCFNLYLPDVGYIQGMGDFVTLLFQIYIRSFKENHQIEFFDGSIVDIKFAESFIFWNFIKLLETSEQDSLFSSMSENQEFIAERAFAIINLNHRTLSQWLETNNLSNLFFMYSTFLLQFRRNYSTEKIMKVWDIFYSYETPSAFIRFFVASILFFIFPEIASEGTVQMGNLISIIESSLKNYEPKPILNLAKQLIKKIKSIESQCDWYFMKMPTFRSEVEGFPKYLSFKD